VTPVRSRAGQRTYSDADVERLALLSRVVKGGRAVGQIARRELQRPVAKDASALRGIPERG
jgi:DNA-binding transcriptional MerR regulator